ncbi:MAG: hypothetical protein WBG90_17995 [Saonia sp.]
MKINNSDVNGAGSPKVLSCSILERIYIVNVKGNPKMISYG